MGHARLATAELLAHEDKAMHIKKTGHKSRTKKRKKPEVKANDDLELQKCCAGKTPDECQAEQSAKEHGMSTNVRPATNMARCSALLPLMPASLVAFDTEVRNTFLHVPLPDFFEAPVRRASSMPPMPSPCS